MTAGAPQPGREGTDMRKAIAGMTDAIERIMDGRLRGVWLYGSVVLDDFRPGWSDIDFIALTDGEPSPSQAQALLTLRQDMLEAEPDNPFYRLFEGVVAGAEEYRRRSPGRLVYWGTSGQKITGRYTPDVFAEFELAKYGEPVYGGKPWILPAPDRERLAEAVRKHCDAIRQQAVRTGGSLYSCGWLLDAARCVYTLRHNDVIAKTKAGLWALEKHIFPDEAPLRRALEIRRNPSAFKDDENVKEWLASLGPAVQRYADVLENELKAYRGE